MTRFYAISDPHGCLDVLEQAISVVDWDDAGNRLFLLGDYVPHCTAYEPPDSFIARSEEAIRYVKGVCEAHPGQVVALKGNHEFDLVNNIDAGLYRFDRGLYRWMRDLALYHETDWQIFVHAGVDEDAGDLWRFGTDDIMFCWKFPPSYGAFYKDIVAGHVGTHGMHGQWGSHDVYWDGQSHYYLDGTTEHSGEIPVLIYDVERGTYASRLATANGVQPANPVLPPE